MAFDHGGRKEKKEYTWKSMLRDFLIFFVLLTILFRVVLGVTLVKGVSMEDTLRNNRVVFFLRKVPRYRVGDVVSVEVPTGELFVKRIVARGGDVLDLRNGTLYINDVPEENPHTKGSTWPLKDGITFPYTVEEGCFFLLGDNREHSLDSRMFGAFPEEKLRGRLLGY